MVYILLGSGFEEIEALTPCDLLRRAGLEVALVGVNGREITGSHRIVVKADLLLSDVSLDDLEMLVLPGGLRGVQSLLASEEALELIRKAWAADRSVCAICAAPTILAKLGLLDGVPATCYPGKGPEMGKARVLDLPLVQYENKITGRAAGSSIDFALALIRELKGPEEAERIAKQIVYSKMISHQYEVTQ